ncbi:NAD(P)H dehydrogenase (quinone) [Cellulomonas flavigena DSM 20109]|uniref:NAD(P)H dehydrogenase (Quinone) n=1 Tax=Cellulomonas flavigena (strain ATCC 482 / DSM 20109 / BCRC 11376 / JCM 18109 / NBRC 3775 / NCIMB 8073 / NRS 134) TaxID=446466 RepID=D5ULI5_CELFN|nr:NAD(P)H-dependent oxidoreductase [Cellulomonas flavigena]ADG74027.1 NAD(P)H dehydrogenase (quinone) [Cellulomonas flavigena DSM 20109]
MHVLVVVGHPLPGSFNHALAHAYADGARTAGADVRVLDLATTPFPRTAPTRAQLAAHDGTTDHLEPEVAALVEEVRRADHLVVLHPQWWGTYPGVLADFLARTLLAGTAFRYDPGARLPQRLLRGRTARTFMTMDSPRLWNGLAYRDAAGATLGTATLAFCGYRVVGRTTFPVVRSAPERRRARWLATAARLGRRDVARLAARHARRASAPPATPVLR